MIAVTVVALPITRRYSSGAAHRAGFRGALVRRLTGEAHWQCLHTHPTAAAAQACARQAIDAGGLREAAQQMASQGGK